MEEYNNIISQIQNICKKIDTINENIDDYTYSNRDFRGTQLSFNVKMYGWFNIESIIKIHSSKLQAQILQEFDDDRLYGIQNHFNSSEVEFFKEEINSGTYGIYFDSKDIYLAGRSGGNLVLGNIENFKVDYWDYIPNEFQVYKNWETFLDLPSWADFIHSDYELKDFKILLEDLTDLLKKVEDIYFQIGRIEARINDIKNNYKSCLNDFLRDEIDFYLQDVINPIEEAENGNAIYLNTLKIENNEIITNNKAKVLAKDAINVFNKYLLGYNIVNLKIGAFTVNDVIVKNKDTYIKIGCHIFAVSQLKKDLASIY